MRKILIITSHFPPSNLVGVHRSRLLSMHLRSFGWEPIILTVHEKYYEEKLDPEIEKLVPRDLHIEKVAAWKITKPRIIGDTGLRGLRTLYKRGKEIVINEKVDFLYVTIPSFYISLLGRLLHRSTGVSYGIDYQDPWVHNFPGSNRLFSRHWFATKISGILEPFAVKKAVLISGVSKGYYEDVIKRNPFLLKQSLFVDLPIGTEPIDHVRVKQLKFKPYLFHKEAGKIKLIYAGAMLPNAYDPLDAICKVLSEKRKQFSNVEIYFVGSGSNTDNPDSFKVRHIAERYGLWNSLIFEHPSRIPYTDVIAHLNEADGILVLGSTDSHYSPSKIYQGIVSGKPIFAALHEKSTAVEIIRDTRAGTVMTFGDKDVLTDIQNKFETSFTQYLSRISQFVNVAPDDPNLQPYLAKSITHRLVEKLDQIVPKRRFDKKILIISPHFPPSNLTSVHRARLFSQYLPDFNWEPIVLTVDEKYYEEKPDYNLARLVSPDTRVEKVNASKVYFPRIIGDIGLRAFFILYRKAKRLIEKEKIDFVYIIIPSFYGALWGRMLNRSTGVKYGIDYIDPWVHLFPGGGKIFSRAWFATRLSRILEPVAIKNASLISGVAESYYSDVFNRNKRLHNHCMAITLPPAAEQKDFEKVIELGLKHFLFERNSDKIQLVYAGAMQPTSFNLLESVFMAIDKAPEQFKNVEFHFIGTGRTSNDPTGYNIKPMAEKYGLWQKQVFEYPARIPYLDVLVHLNAADGVFILGSTEPHYTPSKVYQAVLSGKPILGVLHKESTGVSVIRDSYAGIVLDFDGEKELFKIQKSFQLIFNDYMTFLRNYNYEKVDNKVFEEYSAFNVTKKLAEVINRVINNSGV